ncbi:hypothetical protein JUN65_10685 [Gluconacetobacter azotocaptans]|uniref:hypothetical protein n=1 Tax=Gluconacetobacter azotocaptans TaxID=142834 RepID=UPI0019570B95|nr:hypothetical protein [Gluconacetobacter azotocaptans]MBM9402047.1 hypothetical protein [Gluconacetobacter azotocaptans]
MRYTMETCKNLLEIIKLKNIHLERLSNTKGSVGEREIISRIESWIERPKGNELRILLKELSKTGVEIKKSSFDAIDCPKLVDFKNPEEVQAALRDMTFIEIKTANQKRVKENFEGFFFALTGSEISAAEQLGSKHKVALFNRIKDELLLTSIPEILARVKSMTWQLSVQL